MTTTTRQNRPGSVRISFMLFLLTALWPIVTAVIVWVLASEPTVGGDRDAGYANAIGATISAVIALVQVVIVFRMRAGRRWARIVLLVLTILSVFGVSFGGVYIGFVGLFGIGVSIVTVIAAILMFTPASNRYFRGEPRR